MSADDLADHLDQPGGIEGLDQPASGPSGAAGLLHLVARLDGQDQDRRALELGVLAQLLGQADAIHARHVLVGQDQVDGMKSPILCLLPSILAIHSLDDMEAGVLERERDHLAHGGRIVDGENPVHVVSPGQPSNTHCVRVCGYHTMFTILRQELAGIFEPATRKLEQPIKQSIPKRIRLSPTLKRGKILSSIPGQER